MYRYFHYLCTRHCVLSSSN